jgi:CubicO group peptidase (beta-lactamase class C family)
MRTHTRSAHQCVHSTRMRWWPASIAVFLLTACTVVPNPEEDDVPQSDDRVTRSEAALGAGIQPDEPGCSGAVGVEGEVVWTGTRGVANLSSGADITADTVFDIGWVSNEFTATAVLLLVGDGLLQLEDPVSRYLSGLPRWADDVTIDHLIHHTSGLPDYVDLLQESGVRPEDAVGQADALEAVAGVTELQFSPGLMFQSSGSNYLVLAEIVRAVTGKTLPRVLADEVFAPLGLDMVMDSTGRIPEKAVSYREAVGSSFEEVDWAWEQVGDGGIQTTPTELVRWADNYRTGRLGGSTLQYARLAGAARTSLSLPNAYSEAQLYGAGIFIGIDGGLFDLGKWEGFTTALEITPDRRVAAAVACNSLWLVPSATATILTLIWSDAENRVSPR